VHGYWLADERKMSKSLGNAIKPLDLQEKYGHDAFRYFLLRDMSFGLDASFHEAGIAERVNSDLANDLGNLLHRTLGMLGRYTGGVVPPSASSARTTRRCATPSSASPTRSPGASTTCSSTAPSRTSWWPCARRTSTSPTSSPGRWRRTRRRRAKLGTVLRSVVEALRVASVLLEPVMPTKARELRAQLGLDDAPATLDDARRWDGVPEGTATRPGEPLFPRVDLEALAAAMAEPAARRSSTRTRSRSTTSPSSSSASRGCSTPSRTRRPTSCWS
jgi:methionyl-tRNA synthetase